VGLVQLYLKNNSAENVAESFSESFQEYQFQTDKVTLQGQEAEHNRIIAGQKSQIGNELC
jgi:hypothetical protein